MSDAPKTIPCPYALGATFSLEVSPLQEAPFVVEAKVVHVFSPFTMSSAMKVTLTSESTTMMIAGEAVLKVYDRRFADGIREEYELDRPTYEEEVRYADYLLSDNVPQTVPQIYEQAEQLPDDAPEPPELSDHMVALHSKQLYKGEKTTYSALFSLQGKYIPSFYGTTRFLDAYPPGLSTVPGILIEFIPGTNLSRIDPTSINLDVVCSSAVDIVDRYSDLNVLNRDVRLENFIVKPNGTEVVMIDFGHCRLRRENEEDQEWGEIKFCQDEEGAVGCVARNKFGWSYVESRRYDMYGDSTGTTDRWFNPRTQKTEVIYFESGDDPVVHSQNEEEEVIYSDSDA
ncbi:unnamed protein product [Rhizoctonia solani]|uniref:Protein kinase domain-containing protein n=1 Tax=Rhizoctonia solani TaxID=456999 RepID=A0A8H3CXE6_9AGAM|nr:unnamed protein product [Rhizoctonia solani]